MKREYREGCGFLIPLKEGGFARGVIARAAPSGRIVFGHFFGPRLQSEQEASFEGLQAEQAILSLRFGDLGLVKGWWPIVAQVPGWDRKKWPIQHTVRRDPLGKIKPILVRYDDNDPSKVLSETMAEDDDILIDDGLAGYGFVEAKLSKLLT